MLKFFKWFFGGDEHIEVIDNPPNPKVTQEDFELWAADEGLSLEHSKHRDYLSNDTENAWQGFIEGYLATRRKIDQGEY